MNGKSFYVITADIIGSRKNKGAPVQAEKGLRRLNSRYHAELPVKFTLYRGDEIQGALHSSTDLIRLIRHLRFSLLGLNLRIGVGSGAITAGLEKKYAWQMDGTAFHHSRAALEKISGYRSAATCFSGEEQQKWENINAFYKLIDTIENRWTMKQWQAISAYEHAGTYAAAARELKISPQNVAKRCQAAAWKAVTEVEQYLAACLKEEEH